MTTLSSLSVAGSSAMGDRLACASWAGAVACGGSGSSATDDGLVVTADPVVAVACGGLSSDVFSSSLFEGKY